MYESVSLVHIHCLVATGPDASRKSDFCASPESVFRNMKKDSNGSRSPLHKYALWRRTCEHVSLGPPCWHVGRDVLVTSKLNSPFSIVASTDNSPLIQIFLTGLSCLWHGKYVAKFPKNSRQDWIGILWEGLRQLSRHVCSRHSGLIFRNLLIDTKP